MLVVLEEEEEEEEERNMKNMVRWWGGVGGGEQQHLGRESKERERERERESLGKSSAVDWEWCGEVSGLENRGLCQMGLLLLHTSRHLCSISASAPRFPTSSACLTCPASRTILSRIFSWWVLGFSSLALIPLCVLYLWMVLLWGQKNPFAKSKAQMLEVPILAGKKIFVSGEKRKGYLCGKSLDGESGVVAQNLWFWKKEIPM